MCPAHSKRILEDVKKKLSKRQQFICVSTQLIEAGVDISFDCVIRSVAGLDSIAQAAGRCNRHGEYEKRNVYIIEHGEEKLNSLHEIKLGKESTIPLLAMYNKKPDKYNHNLLSPKALEEYFIHFYQKNEGNIPYPVDKLNANLYDILLGQRVEEVNSYGSANENQYNLILRAGFDTVSKHFQVIDSQTTSIVVPYGRGKELIAILNGKLSINEIPSVLKEIQLYSVQVYPQNFDQLVKNQAVISHNEGMIYELREGFYNEEFGLNIDGSEELDGFIY